MKNKAGRKPLVELDVFVECWNKHSGDLDAIAKELKLKRNTVYARGHRLMKARGVNQNNTKEYRMWWEELK